MIYLLVFLLLLTGGSIALVENQRTRRNLYAVYLCFALPILLIFGGLRTAKVSADYSLYSSWYYSLIHGTLPGNPFLKDPTFAVIGFLVHAMGFGIAAVMLIYCALCMAGQLFFAYKVFDRRWIALGIFLIFCRLFIPHEMTQIRAAAAIPLMSLAVLAFFARQSWRGSLLLLLAASFHLSTIIAIPICLMLFFGVRFNSRKWVVFLAGFGVLGYFTFARIATLLVLFDRTSDYVTGSYHTSAISFLSVYLLCRLTLVGFATSILWKRLDDRDRLLIICSSFGMMLEIALGSNDALSIRSGELFALFDVASALMLLSYLSRRATLTYVLILLCLGGIFFRSSTKIVKTYESRLFD